MAAQQFDRGSPRANDISEAPAATTAGDASGGARAPKSSAPLGYAALGLGDDNVASTACQIHAYLEQGNVLFLADDDRQAEALARAVEALGTAASVIFIPSSDALPGEDAPASPANIGQRVAALRALRGAAEEKGRHTCCILSGEAAAQPYSPPDAFETAPPTLKVGDALDTVAFAEMVEALGYVSDERVDEPGEVAIRGHVVDLFPADAGLPFRIELADGHIAAIRSFRADTQLMVEDVPCIAIGRASEPPLDTATSILAHLRPGFLMLTPKADGRRRRYIALARDAAARRGGALDAIDDAGWKAGLAAWRDRSADAIGHGVLPRFAESRSPLSAFARFAAPLLEDRAMLLIGSERDLRFLRPRLAKRLGIAVEPVADFGAALALPKGSIGSLVVPADRGFIGPKLLVVAAADLLGSRAILDPGDAIRPDALSLEHSDVRVGDLVIHEDHGVARIEGLELAPGESGGEMIALGFSGGARRLVAVADAGRIWRYGADADAVALDKLDGSGWPKRRAAISAAVEDVAAGLTTLAAERERIKAPVLDPDPARYERFVGGFAFNETADQERSFAAVRQDLTSGKPMDRLVIGDVGFGKTEVALRAAAMAAIAGYQVIVAAPTTVLVRQHLALFAKRFASIGVTVAGLSRLSSAAEKSAVKAGLADGSIDIVIGTGAVMGKSVVYRRLGLVIIDEEQKFGAADKARLRRDASVHQLSMSATPIPRTLQMALTGLRQVSLIATAPARRRPVRTSLDSFDATRIRTLLMREHGRRGQSFVVVPRIEDMGALADKLRRAVPELAIVEVHGKLPAKEADAIMVDFADGKGDILLATNIIEAGLDIPRANTMVVWRADRFGLAQLHQLRGRVGRGARRGQMVLLTDEGAKIAESTWKRLRTLAALDQLGAGFEISASDLDARGGGDLLGDTQAGHVKLIGAHLYQHLLGQALERARGDADDDWTPELNVGGAGMIPHEWVPDVNVRLPLYMRLARLASEPEIDAFEEELADRFGPLPPPAEQLLLHVRWRAMARAARIARIDAGKAGIALTPRGDFAGDPAAHGLRKRAGRWVLQGDFGADGAARVQALLEALSF
ncbi:transcription-repair coupling factor (superfamily II helicase) [Sphingopyxis sp. OAS728]|uniref:helicase-related protein n=1 Tax=Sphingopyxis sp. OAS728 TaxID=2663823 RepID=UPI001789A62A|nr:helicase-related protein [Sphingopyxis sp. OAS728]MBE1526910.1 transcription-repair coupling factor (superfamily II helicase) [Sphingopyxis sp. OAS728]